MADPGDARQQAAGMDADSLREVRARAEAVVEQRWSRSKTQLAHDVIALTDSYARLVVERDAADENLVALAELVELRTSQREEENAQLKVAKRIVMVLRQRLREDDPSLPDPHNGTGWAVVEAEWALRNASTTATTEGVASEDVDFRGDDGFSV